MHRLFICCLMALFLTACNKTGAALVTKQESIAEADLSADTGNADDEAPVAVYVCGAVNSPGVYYLLPEAIKEDALLAAGGFATGASENYINLADQITPGEKIYFPEESELDQEELTGTGVDSGGRVNINKATVEELMTLPGIGENKANAIVEYRENSGYFSCIEDIMNIPGIKDGVFNNIKDCIVVN